MSNESKLLVSRTYTLEFKRKPWNGFGSKGSPSELVLTYANEEIHHGHQLRSQVGPSHAT